MNIAKKKKNDAKTVRLNGASLKFFTKWFKCHLGAASPFGGNRDFMVRLVIVISARIKNAVIRIAQPKPTDLIRRGTIMGNIKPPTLDPDATMPAANARRL